MVLARKAVLRGIAQDLTDHSFEGILHQEVVTDQVFRHQKYFAMGFNEDGLPPMLPDPRPSRNLSGVRSGYGSHTSHAFCVAGDGSREKAAPGPAGPRRAKAQLRIRKPAPHASALPGPLVVGSVGPQNPRDGRSSP